MGVGCDARAKQSPYSGINPLPTNSTGPHRPTATTNLLWSHESDLGVELITRASQDFWQPAQASLTLQLENCVAANLVLGIGEITETI